MSFLVFSCCFLNFLAFYKLLVLKSSNKSFILNFRKTLWLALKHCNDIFKRSFSFFCRCKNHMYCRSTNHRKPQFIAQQKDSVKEHKTVFISFIAEKRNIAYSGVYLRICGIYGSRKDVGAILDLMICSLFRLCTSLSCTLLKCSLSLNMSTSKSQHLGSETLNN